MTSTTSNLLNGAVMLAVVIALSFTPQVWAKAQNQWPGIFETDNPIPDEMPFSYMIGFIVALAIIILIGVKYDAFAAILALYAAAFMGVVLIHVPPYIRHQYRRMRGRTHTPLEC